MSNFPTRRHLTCENTYCQICLEDHDALREYFMERLSDNLDWMGKYVSWLKQEGIEPEVNGWASPEAFSQENADKFISYWKENHP